MMTGLILAAQIAFQDPITAANASRVQEIAKFQANKENIFQIAVSPDGKLLASAGIDTLVRLWDLKTFKEVAQLKEHTKQAIAVAFSPDGKTLASAGYDRSLRLWDVASRKQIDVQSTNKENTQWFMPDGLCIAFSPDFSTCAYSLSSVHLWSMREKSEREFNSPEFKYVYGYLSFSGDGKWLAAQMADGTGGENPGFVQIWDWKAAKLASTIKGEAGTFYSWEAIAMNADGSTLAVVDCRSGAIHLWDVKAGKAGRQLKGHDHGPDNQNLVLGLAFSPDGSVLASASYDKTVRLWDVKEGKQVASLASGQDAYAVFSADGSMLATAGLGGTIRIWGTK